MIFSITKYKKKENSKKVLYLMEVILTLHSIGVVRGAVHEV